MALVVGIDEAGFGPLLGPLVVSAVRFRVPDELAEADLWRVLSPFVAVKPRRRHPGIVIGDSKKLHSSQNGLAPLETQVLAALAAVGPSAGTLREFLGLVCPAVVAELDDYPWYRGCDPSLPGSADAMDIRLRGNGFAQALTDAGMELAGAAGEVLLVRRYNELVGATRNKATALVMQTIRLADAAWRSRRDGERVILLADRQGGRAHYLPTLQRMYPHGQRFRILHEEPHHAAYIFEVDGAPFEIHFRQSGETHHLPIALASMLSKYVRELMLTLFNRFWASHLPTETFTPTAGYYTDGKRFLQDIAPVLERLEVAEDLIVRNR